VGRDADEFAHKIDSKVMTSEILRQRYFHGEGVPFWNYEPAQLTFGVEIEYFIGRTQESRDSKQFTLASKADYLATVAHLICHSGYRDLKLPDQPGRVSKDTPLGFIAIKPDFAWHILEVALPPCGDIAAIGTLLESVLHEIDQALAARSLQRLDFSCLPKLPDHMELVQLNRLRGHHPHAVGSPKKIAGDTAALFPALLASTHVHVNCSSEEILARYPALYAIELEALTRFCRAREFEGEIYENVRTSFYRQGLGENYLLTGIPTFVPKTIEEYAAMYNHSPPLFPNDPFFPVRDMSYIRPTRIGTLEFRSACSFLDVETIIAIIEFRRIQILMAHGIVPGKLEKENADGVVA
jgi:hypothetical protein